MTVTNVTVLTDVTVVTDVNERNVQIVTERMTDVGLFLTCWRI